jgi:hypothetical protein
MYHDTYVANPTENSRVFGREYLYYSLERFAKAA